MGQEQPSAATPDPALVAVKTEIEQILKKYAPEAKIQFDGQVLTVDYNVRKYAVHQRFKDLEFSEEATETTGPAAKGISVTMRVVPTRQYEGQRVIGKTFREPYWMEYLNAHTIKGKNEHLWVEIRSGLHADQELIEALRAAAAKVEN
jgi:hypothetical protein